MAQRSLLDDEPTPVDSMQNVFDDQFEVEDFDMVADGFRPPGREAEVEDAAVESEGDELYADDEPVRSISAHYAPGPVSPPESSRNPVRSSISKSRSGMENPFDSPEDDTPTMSFEPSHQAHRSVSSASSHQFAETTNPNFTAGPSHPYGMYQQGTMARSPSTATGSTIRPLNPPPSGPQHPYTLYPQGITDDIDDHDDAPANPVPIGFSGLNQSYHRQMGPDGEEQDIIGQDGHTEQLPPYSRYPEDGPEKVPLLVPTAPVALHSRAPVAGTDPTMELMHNTLQPSPQPQQTREPQSMTDSSTLLGRHSSVSSAERRGGLSSSNSSMYSKKSWSEKSWREKRRTKFCGIPFFWFMIAFGVIGFIAIVAGGVVGGFVEGGRKKEESVPGPSTPLYDASAVATKFAPPPTGTYGLALSTPQAVQAECLVGAQERAWSCELGGDQAAALSITQNGNKTGAYLIYASNNTQTYYGAQTSWMETDSFGQFMTVMDNDNPELGPAYFFQQLYNKLVVLPAELLDNVYYRQQGKYGGGDNDKRDFVLDTTWFTQRTMVKPSDQPWFCVWNNTFVEGFIYMQQNVAASLTSTANTSTATPTSSASKGTSAMGSTITPPPATAVDATITATLTGATTTGTFTGRASDYPDWSSSFVEAYPTWHKQEHGDGGHHYPPRQVTHSPDDLYASLPLFPYIVKIEERRLPNNNIPPYCEKFQLLDDGTFSSLPDPNTHQPMIIKLDETDPGLSAYQSAGIAGNKRSPLDPRGIHGACHCQWMSGQ